MELSAVKNHHCHHCNHFLVITVKNHRYHHNHNWDNAHQILLDQALWRKKYVLQLLSFLIKKLGGRSSQDKKPQPTYDVSLWNNPCCLHLLGLLLCTWMMRPRIQLKGKASQHGNLRCLWYWWGGCRCWWWTYEQPLRWSYSWRHFGHDGFDIYDVCDSNEDK